LAALPEVSYHFEPVATKAAARYVAERQWSFHKARRFYRCVYRWLLRMHLNGDLRLAEKTPQNAWVISFLREAFPGAQFVHLLRDGRDAALSYSKQPWLQESSRDSGRREPGGYFWGPYARFWVEPARVAEFEATSDLHRCIWGWRRHVEAVLNQTALVPAARFVQIRYEEFVRCPAPCAERLLDFLQIDNPASRAGFVAAASNVRDDSVGCWRRELSSDELSLIEAEAGDLLRRLGYVGNATSKAANDVKEQEAMG
jgi:hypothetical protein